MSDQRGTNKRDIPRVFPRIPRSLKQFATTKAELEAALARERDLLRERDELVQHRELLAQEFEHRLVNSLQMIVSLLTLQSRTAATPEGAQQLTIAAGRVAALGRVHRRLHLLDHEKTVEINRYLEDLCDDLSGLLIQVPVARAVAVIGDDLKLPMALGIPLGFIINELITNSVKYASGTITVRIDNSTGVPRFSVSDEGPGLPAGFNPALSTGLGMKIVRSLVKEIGGGLHFSAGEDGGGTRFDVTLSPRAIG